MHSISRKADEIYTGHLCTCMPSQRSYLILLPHIVLTRVLKMLVPLLPLFVVLTCILQPPVSLLPPLAVLTPVLPPPVHLLPPLTVLTCFLPPPVFCVQHVVDHLLPLISHNWHVLIFDYQHSWQNACVLKLPVTLLLPLVMVTCVLSPPVPLLLPLIVLTCVLPPLVHLMPPLAVLTCFLPPLMFHV